MISKYFRFIPVLLLGAVVGLTVLLVRDAADVLPSQIATSLKSVPDANAGSGWLTIIDGEPSNLVDGIRIGLALFLLGGVVTALAGIVTVRTQRLVAAFRSRPQLSHSLLVFQLCSLTAAMFPLLLVSLLVLVSLGAPSDLRITGTTSVVASVVLLNITLNAWGVVSWRTLQRRACPSA